ncbi:unnamed protein product [Calypogeia fissa]
MASTGEAMPSSLVVVGSAIYVEIGRMPKEGETGSARNGQTLPVGPAPTRLLALLASPIQRISWNTALCARGIRMYGPWDPSALKGLEGVNSSCRLLAPANL